MHQKLTRRTFIAAGTTAGLLVGGAAAKANSGDPLAERFKEIEARVAGRLGAFILDTQSGRHWRHRADERFPMCSTFKAFATAAVLARVDAGKEKLDRRIVFRKGDLVPYSPVTEEHIDKGMSLFELCDAAMVMSDNTAANMLLTSLGGPQGVTEFMRSIGDDTTRLDRMETELNEALPGDPRDTTTPIAAVNSLQKLVFGGVLSSNSRQQLQDWLIGNKVSGPLVRKALPVNWRIGDRSGAGGYGTRTIMAVIWPPRRKPVVAAIYLTETDATMDERDAAIAEIGDALVKAVAA